MGIIKQIYEISKKGMIMENDYELFSDESKLDFFIHMAWIPEWHFIKIRNYVNSLENFDGFCEKIFQEKLDDNATEDSVRDLLIIEIIVSTMFLADSLASIAQACSSNPKNIQKFMKEFNTTAFYSKISSMNSEYYAKILSLPQIDHFSGDKKEETIGSINNFGHIMNEIKEYYFLHLDLFNSYKHGFRIFPINSLGENDEIISVVMYFSKRQKQDEAVIMRMDKSPHKHLKIANEIQNIIRTILKNHGNKLKNPDCWEATIPERR